MNTTHQRIVDSEILIVDDMPANIDLLENILVRSGYKNVTGTTDPREAYPLIKKGNYDLIILDLHMPHMDGFGIMDQLAREQPDDYLPILVLTGDIDKETRNRALKAGARNFVSKPFDRNEVINRIENMLEVRALYNDRKQQACILEEKVRERTHELRNRNDQLEQARLDIIRRLGRAGEYRDNETGMHVIRMSKSCGCLATAAGLDDDFADMILQASPMHDVGKIGIPDSILLKPGKLEAGEWDIMKTHSAIGADILGDPDSNLLRLARSIALSHHEKWDGSGYPMGLKYEDIPLEGRITAVCDVFDALTSDRPYKDAWPVAKAIRFINDNSGSHFDPRLVTAFNEILPKILAIREKYADTDREDQNDPFLAFSIGYRSTVPSPA
jgi:putative two-component system response regulator